MAVREAQQRKGISSSTPNNKRKTLKERLATIETRQATILQESTQGLQHDGDGQDVVRMIVSRPDSEFCTRPLIAGCPSVDHARQPHLEAPIPTTWNFLRRVQGSPFAIASGYPEYYSTDRYRTRGKAISNAMPSLLVSSFNALLQNLFCGASQNASATSLAGSKHTRQQILIESRGENGLSRMDRSSLQHLPTDIRTVYNIFKNLEPETTTYACCPNPACCALYAPERANLKAPASYPLLCMEVKFGNPCRTPLVDRFGNSDGESYLKPIKPYVYRHFNDHVAAMLSRSGLEDAIESYAASGGLDKELSDIMTSQAVQEFCDASGQPFLKNDGSELRLVWALAADWYNPHSNKAAGKAVSTGVIALICLSLPPHLRYLEENIYIAGLIPGPHEPTLDAANPFLIPLMHDLLVSYGSGTHFSTTYKYSGGRTSRSAIIPVIADTLASKKVTGYSGHASKYFCSRCRLPRRQIENLNHNCWPQGLARAEHVTLANAWRDAPTKAQQEKLAKKYGVRWSALLLLPYWQPSQWSIQEGFHVLLLGVVPRHCRDLLGLNFKDLPKDSETGADNDDNDSPPPAVMDRARQVLVKGSPAALHKLTMDVLRALCLEKALSIPVPKKRGRLSKKDLINVLLGSLHPNQPFIEGDFDLPALFDGLSFGDQCAPSSRTPRIPQEVSVPVVITQKTLSAIREHIQETLRPVWQAHLPENFGSPEHGKLKADQWRTALEFDLPVSLIQLLAEYKPSGRIQDDSYFRRVVESTLDLAMALAWGLSRRTSKKHAEKYAFYMHRYLTAIQDLFPNYKLKPVHHYALHIQDILSLFGPLHGTWAFSLERLIGRLQDFNTNSKIGEMESTAMMMFCRRANLIAWADSDDIPSTLKAAWQEFCSRRKLRDLNSGLAWTGQGRCLDRSIRQALDPDIQKAFLAEFQPTRQEGVALHFHCSSATIFHSYESDGILYSDFTRSPKSSLIYVRTNEVQENANDLYPAQIRTIFEHSHIHGPQFIKETFVAVHRYFPSNLSKDYFAPYPDFRAGLFCSNPSSNVNVIRASQIRCHANQRPWNASTVVMRAIDRDY